MLRRAVLWRTGPDYSLTILETDPLKKMAGVGSGSGSGVRQSLVDAFVAAACSELRHVHADVDVNALLTEAEVGVAVKRLHDKVMSVPLTEAYDVVALLVACPPEDVVKWRGYTVPVNARRRCWRTCAQAGAEDVAGGAAFAWRAREPVATTSTPPQVRSTRTTCASSPSTTR